VTVFVIVRTGVHTNKVVEIRQPPGMSSHGFHSETKTRKPMNTVGILIIDWPICMHVIDYIYSISLAVIVKITTAANNFSAWIEMSFIILTAAYIL
jgi:hypothetical protein